MPRAKSTRPITDPKELQWLVRLMANTWSEPFDHSQCRKCVRIYTPQVRSGVYQGRSIIRLAWATKHRTKLGAGITLHQTCGTPHCGNLDHWMTRGEEAQRLREAWYSGSYKSVQECVDDIKSPYARVTANQVITRRKHKTLPDVPAEKKLRNEGLLPNGTSTLEFHTDGRIIGPDGHIYRNIREAEISTDIPRTIIACHLNKQNPTGGWRYNPGQLADDCLNWGDDLDMRPGVPPEARQGINIRKGCPDLVLDN